MSEHEQALKAGVALLERAITYALGSLRLVTPATLCRPTPCTGWTLHHLLTHLTDSFQTLAEAAGTSVSLTPQSKEHERPPLTPHPPPPNPTPRPRLRPQARAGARSRPYIRERAQAWAWGRTRVRSSAWIRAEGRSQL
ncbi:maleylpyruvate isomerase N-terminal domain-containing protein [Nonomuraea salmonea]|uniref:maleylpyruvate isomerase N-terminal domain-containing protein n=1 Tax=Nonomuraea salmonea TaxID=46181 RepID=UPI0036087625